MNWYTTWCKLRNLTSRLSALEAQHPHPPASTDTLLIWAEEAGAISSNQQEWSFSNGATGQIGLPLLRDYQIVGMTAQFDVFPAGRTVTITLRDQGPGVDVASAQIVADSDVAMVTFSAPILLAAGTVVGFRTVSVSGGGGVSDGRVVAWLERV